MINAERKLFGIRGRRNIRSLNPNVSNTVKLDNIPGAADTCVISFADEFVQFVGRMLPQGVGPYNPAYVSVTHSNGVYTVWAAYVKNPKDFIPLWRAATRPAWIPEITHNGKNPTTQTDTRPRRDISAYREWQARNGRDAYSQTRAQDRRGRN